MEQIYDAAGLAVHDYADLQVYKLKLNDQDESGINLLTHLQNVHAQGTNLALSSH